jgi:hypothetical protein
MASLDPTLQAQVDSGELRILPLVRFELTGSGETPDTVVGYHPGGRPFTWSGLTYKPNRFLAPEGLSEGLGNEIAELSLKFSKVPTDNADDAIASIENFNYIGAPVTIAYLGGDPTTDQVHGVLLTRFYRIADVRFAKGKVEKNGVRTVSLDITLKSRAARLKDITHAKASTADQQHHNDATDTFYDYVGTAAEWPVEFGQR